MSDPNFGEADSSRELPNTNRIQEYIEQNYDLIIAVEESWDTVNDTIREFLSDDFRDKVLDARLEEIQPGLERATVKSKDLRRVSSEMAERVKDAIKYGHAAAGIIMWSHDDDSSEHERTRSRDAHRIGYYEIVAGAVPEDAAPDGPQATIAEMTCTVADVFTDAYLAEEKLLEPLYEILTQDAMLIENLVDYLEENSQYGNCDGLLAALARAHFDPASISVINECIVAVANTPDAYTERYIQELTTGTQLEDGSTEKDTGIELISLLSLFALKHALPENAVIDFLQKDLDFSSYPSALKADVKDKIEQFKTSIRSRFDALLQPFNLPKRFVVKLRNSPTTPRTNSGNKRQKVISSRTTPPDSRNQPGYDPEQDKPRKSIQRLYLGKKNGGKGSVYTKTLVTSQELEMPKDEVTKDLVEALMGTRDVKDYLRTHSNESDMRLMLEDMIKSPRGQAVSVMNGIRIRVGFNQNGKPASSKILPLFRYSPLDATINDAFSDKETTRTRIAFCTLKDEDGAESIMIIKVGHKTEFEKLTGTMHTDRI